MRTLLLLLAVASVPFISSCAPQACTLEIRSSVTVIVVDALGAPVRDASVTYSVAGGEVLTAACVNTSGEPGCDFWDAGDDEAGAFEIVATAGKKTGKGEVEVESDGCHVDPEVVTITLE